ncbi:MAG: nucleotidyltransferase domain-containing protein [Muribaculaceae bacterium]|nr:nucleotidyltransferase domain-containing protein [Muribaculaceae bacterium]
MNRKESLKAISNVLRKFPEIESYVFGSSARGDYNDSSDIDLLILLPDNLNPLERIKKQQDIIGELLPIEWESGFDISPVILQHKVWNQRKTPFTINVMNERKAL